MHIQMWFGEVIINIQGVEGLTLLRELGMIS